MCACWENKLGRWKWWMLFSSTDGVLEMPLWTITWKSWTSLCDGTRTTPLWSCGQWPTSQPLRCPLLDTTSSKFWGKRLATHRPLIDRSAFLPFITFKAEIWMRFSFFFNRSLCFLLVSASSSITRHSVPKCSTELLPKPVGSKRNLFSLVSALLLTWKYHPVATKLLLTAAPSPTSVKAAGLCCRLSLSCCYFLFFHGL